MHSVTSRITLIFSGLFLLLATGPGAGAALAAAPANDSRTAPATLPVPGQSAGTTVEATLEDGEPGSYCVSSKASVWFTVSGTGTQVAIVLKALGDLDATIDVFERDRSQTTSLDCARTDSAGNGIVSFKARAGSEYLVRVAERSNSVSGDFELRTYKAAAPADLPGRRLPGRGTSDSVNPITNPSDAWSVNLRAGSTYRINLAISTEACVTASLLAPGADDPDERGVRRLSCSRGYVLFTPGRGAGGRYTIVVDAASRSLTTQRYHLEVAKAQRDDTTPGRFWPGSRTRGHLSGNGIDVVDLYNWDLDRTSNVDIDVTGGFAIELISATGRRLGSSDGEDEGISRRLKPGQYYVLVSAEGAGSGRYTLKRRVRTITRTRTLFNGGQSTITSSGSVTVSASVSPGVSGRVEITLERWDPSFGWQFRRVYKGRASGGIMSRSFAPGGIGRWRARAEFLGSNSASKSSSRWSYLRVTR